MLRLTPVTQHANTQQTLASVIVITDQNNSRLITKTAAAVFT